MALADPQSITIGADTISIPRIPAQTGGSFRSNDGEVEMKVSTTYGRRDRLSVRINSTKIAEDPFFPDRNEQVSGSVYLVFDFPKQGFTATDKADIYKGLAGLLSASSYANLVKVLGGEA